MIYLPAHFTFTQKLIAWIGLVARHAVAIFGGVGIAFYLSQHIHQILAIGTGIAVWYVLDWLMAVLVVFIFLNFGGDFDENSVP